ncbi:hypothetical protein N9W79_00510 [bacterium]|nr:hypothetical protein [bacterium]
MNFSKIVKLVRLVKLITPVIVLIGFSSAVENKAYASEISFMTYNVENLFDSKDDDNKKDETFLPLKMKKIDDLCSQVKSSWRKKECESLNWDQEVIDDKMKQLSKVILSYGNGRGADIVVLPEVENLSILKELNSRFLKKAGYVTVELVEGPDVRGIDIGVLSRFKKASASKLHPVVWAKASPKPKRPTRSVLEVTLDIGSNQKASVFGVHFPSPSHSIEERKDAFDTLFKAAEKSKSDLIVAAGDFNVTANEDSRLYRAYSSSKWSVSHHVGCGDCLGTNYYKPYGQKKAKDSWSFLDAIAVSKDSKYKFIPSSVAVWNTVDGMTKGPEKKPYRFNPESGKGYSDHFPLVAKFK